MLGEHDKDFKPRGDSEWFAKLFVCKVCQGEWQFYSHFVIKSLILMKTIKTERRLDARKRYDRSRLRNVLGKLGI